MKKFLSIMLAILMIVTTVPFVLAAEEGDVVILYTNDVHCAYANYPVLAAYRAELIEQGNTVITVDAGDAIQGGLIGAITQGEAIVKLMSLAGYDYAVPGNHEFDYGMDVFLNLAQKDADYKYISSNFCDLRTLESVFEPYYIEDISEDMQIAFVGISTPETITKSTPEYFKDENGIFVYGFPTYDMQDDVLCENIQESVDNAIADGADIVVAVGHLGIEGVTEGWRSTDVIAHTTGIDYFIDSHSHQTINGEVYKNKDGEDVILTSSGTMFENFGEITISPDGSVSFDLIDPDTIQVENMSDSAKEAYDTVKYLVDTCDMDVSFLYDPIGTSETKLVAYEDDGQWLVRRSETNAGDFVTDAYRIMTGADVAICNGGGVRAEIEIGSVARSDLMNMNPWNNQMCIIEVTGQQLIDVLEHGMRSYPEYSGGFLQVSGVTFDLEAWKESPVITDIYGNFRGIDETMERRVTNVKVAGEPIDLQQTYTLAGSEYVLTQGGDGMTMLEGAKIVKNEGILCDSQLLIKYFTDILGGNITAEQYGNPNGDGRITIIDVEPEIPDEPADDTTDNDDNTPDNDDGENTNFFRNIINMIIDFFNRIIRFFTGLFK